MIELDLKRIFDDKGIENHHQFLRKNGFTPMVASRLLSNAKNSIRFKDLEQLCIILHCTPDDLLAWNDANKKNVPDYHPLQKLKPKQHKGNITSAIKKLPMDQIDNVRSYIEGLLKSEPPQGNN